jgi:alkyl hydroperoxide reductase subunit AhpC
MVRKPAPEFKGVSWWGNEFKEISLSQFKGRWVVLFYYPLNFTFVCPTEIVQYNDLSNQFAEVSKIMNKYRCSSYWLFNRLPIFSQRMGFKA